MNTNRADSWMFFLSTNRHQSNANGFVLISADSWTKSN